MVEKALQKIGMERYSLIKDKFPREFVLLQGKGCKWRQCTFCDYHTDTSDQPFEVNKAVLEQVTGQYQVLDIINSGSGYELDDDTIMLIRKIVAEKHIHTLWFEMHYMYKNRLQDFARLFHPTTVKFRCGIETFSPTLRNNWKKGVPSHVTALDLSKHFQGICLLCGTDTEGDTRQRILEDIALAEEYFEYYSINLFCPNSTNVRRNEAIAQWFMDTVYPTIIKSNKAEILINNTDLGVG